MVNLNTPFGKKIFYDYEVTHVYTYMNQAAPRGDVSISISWGAKYGYGPKQIIPETGTLRSETFIFRNIVP